MSKRFWFAVVMPPTLAVIVGAIMGLAYLQLQIFYGNASPLWQFLPVLIFWVSLSALIYSTVVEEKVRKK